MSKRHGPLLTSPVQLKDGRWEFSDYWTTGKRRQVRRRSESEIKTAYGDLLALVERGRRDLLNIDPTELAQFRAYAERQRASVTGASAVEELLEEKRHDKDAKQKWLRVLGDALRIFRDEYGEDILSDLKHPQMERWMRSLHLRKRTWNNLRGPIVQLFRWARAKDYLPDRTTEAERIKRFRLEKTSEITHWEPEEMAKQLACASEDDRVWPLLGGFAGVRTEELMPEYKDKDPLRWEDFDWAERIIEMRPETSKVNEGRNIPLSPQLLAWMAPYRGRIGPCIPIGRRPRVITRHIEAAGGHKHRANAYRHSYGLYRRLETRNIAQVAEEMGTSVEKVKTNYSRRKHPAALRKWKAIRPREQGKVIPFQSQVSNRKIASTRPNRRPSMPAVRGESSSRGKRH